jgi:hypothetical protein
MFVATVRASETFCSSGRNLKLPYSEPIVVLKLYPVE